MRTGLKKQQKVTEIFYNAKDPKAEIYTHDTKLKKRLLAYAEKHPELLPLYEEIYNRKDRSYFEALEKKAEEMAKKHGCRFVDNETPYERVPKGHPIIVDYFYHEEVRGTENSGQRRTKNG